MFKTNREDGYSYRDIAVTLLKDQPPNTLITYTELGKALDTKDMHLIQSTVIQANKVLLKQHQRGVKNVRRKGYRILRASEHMAVATSHQSKAERQMVKAIDFFAGANLSEMTDIERKLHVQSQMLATATLAGFQHLDKRLSKIEELLRGTTTINPSE